MSMICYGMGTCGDTTAYEVDIDIPNISVDLVDPKVIETQILKNDILVDIEQNNILVNIEIIEKEVDYGC